MSGWAWFSEELLAFPAAGEFSLSAASAFLPGTLGPFLMSPREPFASVQKLHSGPAQDQGSWSKPKYQGNLFLLNSAGREESSISNTNHTGWWLEFP